MLALNGLYLKICFLYDFLYARTSFFYTTLIRRINEWHGLSFVFSFNFKKLRIFVFVGWICKKRRDVNPTNLNILAAHLSSRNRTQSQFWRYIPFLKTDWFDCFSVLNQSTSVPDGDLTAHTDARIWWRHPQQPVTNLLPLLTLSNHIFPSCINNSRLVLIPIRFLLLRESLKLHSHFWHHWI